MRIRMIASYMSFLHCAQLNVLCQSSDIFTFGMLEILLSITSGTERSSLSSSSLRKRLGPPGHIILVP
ncbi:unnamed protein product [Cercopithifilaria johnstoni]|uniref:Uncharacterized protein n=1 Tax=Cercopithifilaria johnstoni TaxID=2874296 RepID=A0A8J2LWA1_9BILA|nr:unnamed protein product [Cercopithifilaria johnstoni]